MGPDHAGVTGLWVSTAGGDNDDRHRREMLQKTESLPDVMIPQKKKKVMTYVIIMYCVHVYFMLRVPQQKGGGGAPPSSILCQRTLNGMQSGRKLARWHDARLDQKTSVHIINELIRCHTSARPAGA